MYDSFQDRAPLFSMQSNTVLTTHQDGIRFI